MLASLMRPAAPPQSHFQALNEALNEALSGTRPPVPPAIVPDQLEANLYRYGMGTIEWVTSHMRDIGVALGLGIGIYLLLAWLRGMARKRAGGRDVAAPGAIFWRTLARTNGLFMAMVPVQLIALIANPPPRLGNALILAFFAVMAFQIALWAREVILGLVQRRAGADGQDALYNAIGIIRLLVTVALFAIAAIVVLDTLGVNVGALIAGLGIGGIAIGLAAQGIFADLFAALSILFDKPFRRGDVVQYDGTTARVEKIGLKSTRLRALSGEEKIISNTNLLSKEITNLTLSDARRVRLTIGLVHHSPVALLRAFPAVAEGAVIAAGSRFVRAGILQIGASSIDLEVDIEVESDDLARIGEERHAVAIALIEALRRDGYELAYPTQTTYTAAPDGTLVMPYAAPGAATPARAATESRRPRKSAATALAAPPKTA